MQTTTGKIELIGYLILGEIKLCNLKNIHFEKKKPQKLNNIINLHFMTTLNNVVFKIEIVFVIRGCLRPL